MIFCNEFYLEISVHDVHLYNIQEINFIDSRYIKIDNVLCHVTSFANPCEGFHIIKRMQGHSYAHILVFPCLYLTFVRWMKIVRQRDVAINLFWEHEILANQKQNSMTKNVTPAYFKKCC